MRQRGVHRRRHRTGQRRPAARDALRQDLASAEQRHMHLDDLLRARFLWPASRWARQGPSTCLPASPRGRRSTSRSTWLRQGRAVFTVAIGRCGMPRVSSSASLPMRTARSGWSSVSPPIVSRPLHPRSCCPHLPRLRRPSPRQPSPPHYLPLGRPHPKSDRRSHSPLRTRQPPSRPRHLCKPRLPVNCETSSPFPWDPTSPTHSPPAGTSEAGETCVLDPRMCSRPSSWRVCMTVGRCRRLQAAAMSAS